MQVKRIVVTGAATSVIGVENIQPSYEDATKWASSKFEGRPNEYAKFAAEKVCWDEILAAENLGSQTQMDSLLPYFISGPPLYKESFNSSCEAITSILNSTQFGFPQV